MLNKRVAVIGSREAPDDVCKLIKVFTNILIELGYCIYSGGCPVGVDAAATRAIAKHKSTDKSKHRIYIAYDGMADLHHDPSKGIYDATFFDNYDIAGQIANIARNGWYGLYEKGIKLHSRNPYQVLGDDLCSPVAWVLTWAKPKGKEGHVKGGTGTAVRIAVEHNIKVYNLYYPAVLRRVEEFVTSVMLTRKLDDQHTGRRRTD